MKVRCEHIRKSYGDQVVLEDINFELNKGEIVGLLGRNGAGKSTLLKILAGINPPDGGTLELPNDRVAYLSEANPLYPHMYVLEYLEWLADVKKIQTAKNRIRQIIQQVGLEDVRTKKIFQLSKGYRQRLGLAATLLANPDVLILDEPINGLDPVQITEYRNLIRSISSDKIILLSSHLMQEIEALCDRVLFLDEGCIAREAILRNRDNLRSLRLKLDRKLKSSIFKDLDGIQSVEKKEEDIYIVSYDRNSDPRTLIFDTVVANGAKILEMAPDHDSLQNMFE